MQDIKTITAGYRCWAEIYLENLLHNYRQARLLAPKSAVMPVLKADAYGHGAIAVAKALAREDPPMFAVATAEEAFELRANGIEQPVLVLGVTPAANVRELARQGIAVTVPDPGTARDYSAVLNGDVLAVHIKLDTGMHRLGLDAARHDAAVELMSIAAIPGIRAEGIYTHLAAAEDSHEDLFTRSQYALLEQIDTSCIAPAGARPPLRHCANSAAVIGHPQSHFDMVRPGLMLYGYDPCEHLSGAPGRPELRVVMALRAVIMQISSVANGESVGYNRAWTNNGGERRIATVSVGYADGLPRSCSGKIALEVHGKPAPQAGIICMDMCMIDVTGIEGVRSGDTVTVFGPGGQSAADIAAAGGTISREVLCGISGRVPRVYMSL